MVTFSVGKLLAEERAAAVFRGRVVRIMDPLGQSLAWMVRLLVWIAYAIVRGRSLSWNSESGIAGFAPSGGGFGEVAIWAYSWSQVVKLTLTSRFRIEAASKTSRSGVVAVDVEI
jgi:hypothetical protein